VYGTSIGHTLQLATQLILTGGFVICALFKWVGVPELLAYKQDKCCTAATWIDR